MSIGFQVTFDAIDPARLADFWAEALVYELEPPPAGFATWEDFGRAVNLPAARWNDRAAVRDPEGSRPGLVFQRVHEGGSARNRVRLDVHVSEGAADMDEQKARARAHVERLVQAGAAELREVDGVTGWCIVLTDPEGNEFCVR
ncbi:MULTISPECIES: VOC family protein [Actinoalloteichus]|uniref:Glyoxalase-like domain-containing protein n=1 Tax=Actinoalloteichus fjordicus TaxID=1612552 RepID=A0AAC9LD57_9PSEU|nr:MULTISPECIES: VOC family protein [Actinoalloteichus]APU14200.1 hypothetical protein UA74_10700 [Actinoalloteichus fjordicus]APU20169.1 hypothetical protein UA75_10785 [Actinoalloteichus sp. GBA129-24]